MLPCYIDFFCMVSFLPQTAQPVFWAKERKSRNLGSFKGAGAERSTYMLLKYGMNIINIIRQLGDLPILTHSGTVFFLGVYSYCIWKKGVKVYYARFLQNNWYCDSWVCMSIYQYEILNFITHSDLLLLGHLHSVLPNRHTWWNKNLRHA